MTKERIAELREEVEKAHQSICPNLDWEQVKECLDAIEQLQHELQFARITAIRAMDAGYQEKP